MTRNGTWTEAWQDLFDYHRDPAGYLRREAFEVVKLKHTEEKLGRAYHEVLASYRTEGWQKHRMSFEDVASLVEPLKAKFEAAQQLRAAAQGEFEYHVANQHHDCDDQQIIMRETLLREAALELAESIKDEQPQPLANLMQARDGGPQPDRLKSRLRRLRAREREM
jgi:hypothetical protein